MSTARDHDLHVKRSEEWVWVGTKSSSRLATAGGISGAARVSTGFDISEESDAESLTVDSFQLKPFSGIQLSPGCEGHKDGIVKV